MLDYTNLEIHINFTNGEEEDILEDITKVLEKHGYSQFSRRTGPDDKSFIQDKVEFYPKECI
jgi:hypothetical protein